MDRLPLGLDTVAITVLLRGKAEHGAIEAAVSEDERFLRAGTGWRALVTLSGQVAGAHGLVNLVRGPKGTDRVLTLELLRGTLKKKVRRITGRELIDILTTARGGGEPVPQEVLLSCNYSLEMREWTTVLGLPFADNRGFAIPGSPLLAGVDFEFERPSEDHAFLRAFVTTYSNLGKIVVRLLSQNAMEIHTGIWADLIAAAEGKLALFARRRSDEDKSVEG